MAAEFSLNTQMYLLSKKSLWLSDGSMGFGHESDVAFAEGITLKIRGLLCMFYIVSVVLCFIGIVFEGRKLQPLVLFWEYNWAFITVVGVEWVIEIGYMLLDGFISGEVNLCFPNLTDLGNKSVLFSWMHFQVSQTQILQLHETINASWTSSVPFLSSGVFPEPLPISNTYGRNSTMAVK